MILRAKDYEGNGLTYTIRSAVEADATRLAELRQRIDGETEYLDREPGEGVIDAAGFAQIVAADSASCNHLFLVAEAQGALLGFARCEGSAYARLRHQAEFGICVAKAHWGHGVGKNLLACTVAWADKSGLHKILLKVLATNTKAIEMYKRYGFVVEGTLRDDKRLADGRYYNTVVMGRLAGEKKQPMHDHGHCVHHHGGQDRLQNKIAFLEAAERRRAVPPEDVLEQVGLKPVDDVLDLGAGTGYLALPAAGMTKGQVHALDVDADMLAMVGQKAQEAGLANVNLLQGSMESIPLADASVDVVLASLVLHEVRALDANLAQVARVLRPGGRFLCLEYEKDERSGEGPPMEIRIASGTLETQLEQVGFYKMQKRNFGEFIYVTAHKNG